MGITKTVAIGKRAFHVKELTCQQIHDLDLLPAKSDVIAFLLSSCTDTDISEIMPMAPSDLAPLVDALVEVNSAFFQQATKAQEVEVAKLMETRIRLVSMTACFCSSSQGTEKVPGDTHSQDSLEP